MKRTLTTIDGNEAVAYVADRINEVIAIYPITPSSPMGEWSDNLCVADLNGLFASEECCFHSGDTTRAGGR
jgi:pyruvate-ferredoxin/flavodoxin oxidoreductase